MHLRQQQSRPCVASEEPGRTKCCAFMLPRLQCRCWAVLTRLQNCCGCTVSLPCLIVTGMTPPAAIVDTCRHQYRLGLVAEGTGNKCTFIQVHRFLCVVTSQSIDKGPSIRGYPVTATGLGEGASTLG